MIDAWLAVYWTCLFGSQKKKSKKFCYDVSVRQNADGAQGAAGGERESGVSPSGRVVCYSVAPWLRKFGFIHSRNVGIKLQSWTKSVKNFALSYSQETHSANLATRWPLPGQCCLVGSKNIPTSTLFFFGGGGGGGSILSEPGFRRKYSKILGIQRAFFLTFLSKIVFSRYWRICPTVNIRREKKVVFFFILFYFFSEME